MSGNANHGERNACKHTPLLEFLPMTAHNMNPAPPPLLTHAGLTATVLRGAASPAAAGRALAERHARCRRVRGACGCRSRRSSGAWTSAALLLLPAPACVRMRHVRRLVASSNTGHARLKPAVRKLHVQTPAICTYRPPQLPPGHYTQAQVAGLLSHQRSRGACGPFLLIGPAASLQVWQAQLKALLGDAGVRTHTLTDCAPARCVKCHMLFSIEVF